jgi:hypothetical protein
VKPVPAGSLLGQCRASGIPGDGCARYYPVQYSLSEHV